MMRVGTASTRSSVFTMCLYGNALNARCACPLSVCPRCPAPGVSAVACPSSRVSCPGVEICAPSPWQQQDFTSELPKQFSESVARPPVKSGRPCNAKRFRPGSRAVQAKLYPDIAKHVCPLAGESTGGRRAHGACPASPGQPAFLTSSSPHSSIASRTSHEQSRRK